MMTRTGILSNWRFWIAEDDENFTRTDNLIGTYLKLHNEYQIKCRLEKEKFYRDIICKAKEADPNSWYRLLKRITNYDQTKKEDLQVKEISPLSDREQVEQIAHAFNAPSKTYKPLQNSDIILPHFSPEEVPNYTSGEIREFITRIKTNKSTIHGNIPARILKRLADIFCIPLCDIINTIIQTGSWPVRYKIELITLGAKVTPTEKIEQLRPISNSRYVIRYLRVLSLS